MPRTASAPRAIFRHPPRRGGRPGEVPGTLAVDPAAPRSEVRVIAYGPGDDALRELALDRVEQLDALDLAVVWIDVVGLGDEETLRALGQRFKIHPLVLEDVVHVHQRPKLESYSDQYFLVTRSLHPDAGLDTEQISFVFGRGFLITFQERRGDGFEPVRERLRRNQGRVRTLGADYLAYALVDATVDLLFPVLEAYGDRLAALEEAIFAQQAGEALARKLLSLRAELLSLRRVLWPMRDALSALQREESPLIDPTTVPYLRDCVDHLAHVIDMVEHDREAISSMMDANLSMTSYKLNEVMKLLTVIATIFIPLGFVAGLYGMNFDRAAGPWNMPELGWAYGYPFALGVMLTISLGLLAFFHRKGWL
ncbi:MAG: magnesium/cobalt transporter CorA [Deltaproteobacteria bacterium]|nr:magnesium/cobalt transporter CorA [Deltaproteobacteria bacterium]